MNQAKPTIHAEDAMRANGTSSSPSFLRYLLLLALLLVAPAAARAQSTTSTSTPTVAGVVLQTGLEAIICSGQVKVSTTATPDPALGPSVVVSIDARGLSCVGKTSGASYANSGQANLTRKLGNTDAIFTTFALYKKVPGGFLDARTALLVLKLSFNAATGALANVTGAVTSSTL